MNAAVIKKLSYFIFLYIFNLCFNLQSLIFKIDNKIHLYMMLTMNLLILLLNRSQKNQEISI
jgi:hypothetical protein